MGKLVSRVDMTPLPSLLGSEDFVDWVKASFQSLRSHREVLASRLLAPSLAAIQSAVYASYGADQNELLSSRRGMSNDARSIAIYLARRLFGQTLAATGDAFGLEHYSSVSSVVSRTKQWIADTSGA
jgi:chromosomal replication initiation ATPase DnaA